MNKILYALCVVTIFVGCNKQDYSDPKEVINTYVKLKNNAKYNESFEYIADTCKSIVTLQEYVDYYSKVDSDSINEEYTYEIKEIKQLPLDPLHPNYRLYEVEYFGSGKEENNTTKGYWYYTTINQNQHWKIVWTNNLIQSGQKLYHEQRFEDAIASFEEILKYNPMDGKIYKGIGQCHYRLGNYKEAKKFAQKAIELEPNNYINLNFLANIYNDTENKDLAIENYKRAINLCYTEKSKSGLYANLASTYLDLNKIPEAKEHIEKAIVLEPNYTFGWWTKGRIYIAEDDRSKALNCYEKAISLKPMEGYLQSLLYYDYAFLLYRSNYAVKVDFTFEVTDDIKQETNRINNNLDKARTYALKALDMDPDNESYKDLFKEINNYISR